MRLLESICIGPADSSFRQATAWLPVLALCAAATITPAAVEADDGMFVVVVGATWIEIPEADLLATIPGATGPVSNVTPPGRGGLFDLDGFDVFLPAAEFFEQGSDSFHFEAQSQHGGSVWGTAFLTAGMKGDNAFFMPLDDPAEIHWVSQVGSMVQVNEFQPINGAYDLRVDLRPSPPSYVMSRDRGGDPGDGPKGGTLGSGIDGGGGWWQGPAELRFAAALDLSEQEMARVVLIGGESGLEIAGEVKVGAGFARTKAVPIGFGDSWQLQWWGATGAGSQDGGALLLIDGVVVAQLADLDNPELTHPSKWSFGALQNTGFEGAIQLDDLRGEAARTRPRVAPVFADNFQAPAPVWSGRACGASPVPVAASGTLTVPIDREVVDCFLSRRLDQSEPRLRSRFSFDLTNAAIGSGGVISVLRGRQAGGDANPLEVLVRRSAGGALEIRASTVLSGGLPLDLPWREVPESGEISVEMLWWSASSPLLDDGGLILSVEGLQVERRLGLSNDGLEVAELYLGAMSVGTGSAGEIAFGPLEAWR